MQRTIFVFFIFCHLCLSRFAPWTARWRDAFGHSFYHLLQLCSFNTLLARIHYLQTTSLIWSKLFKQLLKTIISIIILNKIVTVQSSIILVQWFLIIFSSGVSINRTFLPLKHLWRFCRRQSINAVLAFSRVNARVVNPAIVF